MILTGNPNQSNIHTVELPRDLELLIEKSKNVSYYLPLYHHQLRYSYSSSLYYRVIAAMYTQLDGNILYVFDIKYREDCREDKESSTYVLLDVSRHSEWDTDTLEIYKASDEEWTNIRELFLRYVRGDKVFASDVYQARRSVSKEDAIIRRPIQLTRHTVAVIHLFTKTDDFDDLWMMDFWRYMEETYDHNDIAAEQFIEQLQDKWTPAFMMSLIDKISEALVVHDKKFGTSFFMNVAKKLAGEIVKE